MYAASDWSNTASAEFHLFLFISCCLLQTLTNVRLAKLVADKRVIIHLAATLVAVRQDSSSQTTAATVMTSTNV